MATQNSCQASLGGMLMGHYSKVAAHQVLNQAALSASAFVFPCSLVPLGLIAQL